MVAGRGEGVSDGREGVWGHCGANKADEVSLGRAYGKREPRWLFARC